MFVNISGRPGDVPVTTSRKRRAHLPQPVIQSAYTYAVISVTCFTKLIYNIYVYIYSLYIILFIIIKVRLLCDRCDCIDLSERTVAQVCTHDIVRVNVQRHIGSADTSGW